MKKLKKIIFIIFIFAIFSCQKTFAQGVDLGIYPPIIQAELNPPSEVKIPLYLQNFSDESVSLSISLKTFRPSDQENGQQEIDENPDFPDAFIVQRIHVLDGEDSINSITLSPKQTKNLAVEFKIPGNEPKGDYYFSLVFSTNNQSNTNSSATQAQGGIATNILLTVGPLGKTNGILEDFSSPIFVMKGPVPFNVRLRNTSDHYITPTGEILITNMFGQMIGKVPLLPVNVLANSVRRIPDKAQSGSNSDYEKIKKVVEINKYPVAIWPENFLLGWYKAEINLSLSSDGPNFKRTIQFFAFPAEYILGILAIIGIILYVTNRVRKKVS